MNNKMNKKDEQKKSYRILSYIFLVCGTINFILLFFNGDGFIENKGKMTHFYPKISNLYS